MAPGLLPGPSPRGLALGEAGAAGALGGTRVALPIPAVGSGARAQLDGAGGRRWRRGAAGAAPGAPRHGPCRPPEPPASAEYRAVLGSLNTA